MTFFSTVGQNLCHNEEPGPGTTPSLPAASPPLLSRGGDGSLPQQNTPAEGKGFAIVSADNIDDQYVGFDGINKIPWYLQ